MTSDLDLLIFVLPFAFMLHNLEEIFGMEKWTKSIPRIIHSPVTTRQFAIAVGLFTLLGFVLIFSENFLSEKYFLMVVTGFAGMLFLNVFFPHLMATLYFKKYAPGVITGLLINLPLTALILYTIYHSQMLTPKAIILSCFIGGVTGVALAFTFLRVGKYMDDKLKPAS